MLSRRLFITNGSCQMRVNPISGPGTVIVSRDTDQSSYDYRVTHENIEILESSTDANGNPLKLVIIDTPWHINEQYGTKSFAAGYVGYYVCNHAVIMQKFGDVEAAASIVPPSRNPKSDNH